MAGLTDEDIKNLGIITRPSKVDPATRLPSADICRAPELCRYRNGRGNNSWWYDLKTTKSYYWCY